MKSSPNYSPDDEGAGGAPGKPAPLSLADAIKTLDSDNDSHWTADGLPAMAYLEGLVQSTAITRADVDAFAVTRNPAPEPTPAPAPVALPSVGRIVIVTVPGGFDGADMAPAIVTRVVDGSTINAKVFAPNGGADAGFTGLQHISAIDGKTDPADKNVATWDWPARN